SDPLNSTEERPRRRGPSVVPPSRLTMVLQAHFGAGFLPLSPGPRQAFIITGNRRPSRTYLRAKARSVGERAASIPRSRTSVILSTFQRGCRTWKSILQQITALSGLLCE